MDFPREWRFFYITIGCMRLQEIWLFFLFHSAPIPRIMVQYRVAATDRRPADLGRVAQQEPQR